jgi:hypothetical protein
MKGRGITVALAGCVFMGSLATASGDEPAAASGPHCEVAVVNPVSNYAECVKPRGAHVDPPPKRAAPTEEECRRHPDLDVEECRQYVSPPTTIPPQ